eukprot:1160998-Pelagomonas_calceolata.AAC.2
MLTYAGQGHTSSAGSLQQWHLALKLALLQATVVPQTRPDIDAQSKIVVVTPQTRAALGDAKAHGRSTWRVSSTLFCHLASDAILEPLGHFAHTQPEALQRYPPRPAGFQVRFPQGSIVAPSGGDKESASKCPQPCVYPRLEAERKVLCAQPCVFPQGSEESALRTALCVSSRQS